MDMQINFPNLGIYLENVGKSFSVFGFEVAFYGCAIAIGIMAGYMIATHEAKRTGQNPYYLWGGIRDGNKFQTRLLYKSCSANTFAGKLASKWG